MTKNILTFWCTNTKTIYSFAHSTNIYWASTVPGTGYSNQQDASLCSMVFVFHWPNKMIGKKNNTSSAEDKCNEWRDKCNECNERNKIGLGVRETLESNVHLFWIKPVWKGLFEEVIFSIVCMMKIWRNKRRVNRV